MSVNVVLLLILGFVYVYGEDDPPPTPSNPFYEFLPTEMKNFLKEITPEDKKLIKEMLPVLVAARAANDSLTDLDVFELIKPKSESLYHKVLDLRNGMLAHINRLPEKPRNFIKETYERAWKGAQSGKDHISQLMFLKQVYDGAKQKLTRAEVLEVYKEFPIVDKIFEDKDVKSLLQGIEGKNAEEVKQFVKEHNVQFELKVPLHKT